MKRFISMLLAVIMCIGVVPHVFAIGVGETEVEIPEEPAVTVSEDAVAGEDYTENVVLFALKSADYLAIHEDALAKIGVKDATPLFTEDGEAASFGTKSHVWYRATVSGEVTDAISTLVALDGVVYAEPEYIYETEAYGEPSATEISASWAYDNLHKQNGKHWWKELDKRDIAPGTGTVVAVIDTGVDYTHEDLSANMWVNTAELYGTEGVDDDGNGYIDDVYGVDVTATGAKAGNPMDDHGHGTHVAGIIGMTANDIGGVGIAYGAKIMAIKAGYSTGSFSSTAIAKAINYAHMMGADVINMSFGGSGMSYLVEEALESAFSDCVLVASAGNNGMPTKDAPSPPYLQRIDIYPAGYSYVIGVMASDGDGVLAYFSNWDYKPNANCEYEITAPGVSIYSALPGDNYAEWSGTSMSAPMVSAAAAILRSYFDDKDMYSSRFIMGQLVSATEDITGYLTQAYEYFEYPALNIFDSIDNLPKPNVTVKDSFLMDNVGVGKLNDGDAIIDAGEIIDLGVLIRNQWGQTGEITVKVDAISDGGVANPFIEFITDEITLQPAGTFAEVDNGWVRNDSYLESVSNPIKFIVAKDTPNDTEIRLNITVTTTNGVDEEDDAIYTTESTYTFRVQAGRGIKGTIHEDMTLTNDYLWIVENAILIPEGVTVTVEPGTKIQFGSPEYEDAYGGETMPQIINEGTFNAIGTEDEPIEMYVCVAKADYLNIRIDGSGIETLIYCKTVDGSGFSCNNIEIIDHCYFEFGACIERGTVTNSKLLGGDTRAEIIQNCYITSSITDARCINNVFSNSHYMGFVEYIKDQNEHVDEQLTNNAIILSFLDLNRSFNIITANSYNKDALPNYATNNYWGTENDILINKMIIDADDYAGSYQDVIHEPILTLDSPSLADIYPFVTKVYMTDSDGNIVANVTPGEEYDVHVLFNRDMDMDTQPSISYGPAEPYTDYSVQGEFVSPREWVGKTKISPVLTSGTMFFRTKGGVAADDKWLECGEDILRFSFNVSTTGALAMMLNAEGGANKIELSWAQNDYDVLAGYNIYRSESPDGYFEKINLYLVTENDYVDTDVLPGVTYYYYFKVVNTDGNEEENTSNIASAAPIDNIPPTLQHSPIENAKANSSVTISATASDNIAVEKVTLYYRVTGSTSFKSKSMTKNADSDRYVAVIPASDVTAAGVEYYIVVEDTDGNLNRSGTANVPHRIYVNSAPYISGITPSKIGIEGGKTVTILGGNFTEDITLKIGSTVVEEISVVNSGTITFIAPAMSSGAYALTITNGEGKSANSPTPISYVDSSSVAEIPTNLTITSGVETVIPLYVTSASDIFSLHAEIDLPAEDFVSYRAELVDPDSNALIECTRDGDTILIGCIGSSNINPEDGPIINLIVVASVADEKQYELKLHDVSFNGVEASTMISCTAVIKPSFTINAEVVYYSDYNRKVHGVKITADGVSAVTDESGIAAITVNKKTVTVTASGTSSEHAVSAFDASLVLQAAVKKITLDEYQLLAADVDGNGKINEYDAALILQKAVRKIDTFPIGTAWIFAPASTEMTLFSGDNTVRFLAISVGDVDGSYMGD